MTPDRSSDHELVERYLLGAPDAVDEITGWIRAVVLHRAWRLPDAGEDLVQDGHARLVRALREGRFGGRSSLKTFAQSVAKHLCLDAVRRHRVRTLRAAAPEENDRALEHALDPDDYLVDVLEQNEEVRRCREVLDALPDTCRKLFRWILMEEKSYQEMARRMEVSVGTIKSRLSRCRDRAIALRSTYDDEPETPRGPRGGLLP